MTTNKTINEQMTELDSIEKYYKRATKAANIMGLLTMVGFIGLFGGLLAMLFKGIGFGILVMGVSMAWCGLANLFGKGIRYSIGAISLERIPDILGFEIKESRETDKINMLKNIKSVIKEFDKNLREKGLLQE